MMGVFPATMLAEVACFALAASRVAGVILTAPFPGRHAPAQAKIALVLLCAWVARAASSTPPHVGFDLRLIGVGASELGIGLVIGFTVRVTFAVAEVLGGSFAQATGMTMGQVYDPALGAEEPVASRVATILAMLLFVTVGAHRVALAYVLDSFRAMPVGSSVTLGAAALPLADYAGDAIGAGVRLALPVTGVSLGVQGALSLVARASPSLQVFSVGLAVSVAAGILALIASLDDVGSGLVAELSLAAPRIARAVDAVAGSR